VIELLDLSTLGARTAILGVVSGEGAGLVANRRTFPRAALAGWTVGAAAAAAATAIGVLVGLPGGHNPPFEIPAAVLGVATFGALAFLLSFERNGSVYYGNFSEIPLLVGIVFAPARIVLLARVIADAGYFGGALKKPLYRVWFNCSMIALNTVVALELYAWVLGAASPVSRRGWMAAAAALVGCELSDWICMLAVLGLSAGKEAARSALGDGPVLAPFAFTNGCVALIAVLVLWNDWLGGVLLAGACAVLGLGYQTHQRLRRRAEVLGRIHDFTQGLDSQSGMEGMLAATLEGARKILGGRIAELWLQQGPGWLHYTSTEGNLQVCTADRPRRLERRALKAGHGILVARATKRSERSTELSGLDADDAMAVPLQNPQLEGVLTVASRLDPAVTFTADDMRALESMAAHAGVALHSAFLLDRVAREAEEKEYQALHDGLTGLPNRTLFATDVEAILASRGGDDKPESAAVMLLDLDSFKEVNDTLGHGVGDVVLKVIASRLTAEIGDRGVVARLGGDEYAVIVPVADRDEAMREAEAVKRCVEDPIDEEGLLIEPRTSIGVAMSPENGDDASTLLRLADVAMYSAKEHRVGITLYEAKFDHYSPRRLTLAGELRQAIEAGELLVTYQPQQDLETGAIRAVEALLRWNHKVHGFIPPDEFIPVAEQTGLIVPLTDYVLTESLRQQNRWARLGLDLEVAVNLSPRLVQDGQLPAIVAQRLAETGSDATRLTLELTETGLATDHSRVAAILHQLAVMGVRISIDDFGTGYSSLSRLSDLPVNEVKIDKSFVFAMANGAPDTVVSTVIALGHSLGLRVVAEGVEDLGTLEVLRRLDCDAVQGYFLSRAVPPNVLEAWLADQDVGPVERVIVPLRKSRG
jgi:diguanylate cyclase (GGDEF)-like protein